MKRPVPADEDIPDTGNDKKMKKIKTEEEEEGEEEAPRTSALMNENLLYEVLKHVDARTLGTAACVSKQWHRTAQEVPRTSEIVLKDENLLYEVLKHVDARTLGTAACVSKQWHRTAQDERLWELICTRHGPNNGCGNQQLRSVVLSLGGFRRLHSLYLWPLLKPSPSISSSSSSAWPCLPPPPVVPSMRPTATKNRWGKDEVHLSLSLLSIRYYEKMNFNNRSK